MARNGPSGNEKHALVPWILFHKRLVVPNRIKPESPMIDAVRAAGSPSTRPVLPASFTSPPPIPSSRSQHRQRPGRNHAQDPGQMFRRKIQKRQCSNPGLQDIRNLPIPDIPDRYCNQQNQEQDALQEYRRISRHSQTFLPRAPPESEEPCH